jgi:cbb3-type cytochrome oxidase maturation protein
VSVLYLVVPVALVLVAAALAAFAWAARRGQFDDLTTPALRALQDDTETRPPPTTTPSPTPPEPPLPPAA